MQNVDRHILQIGKVSVYACQYSYVIESNACIYTVYIGAHPSLAGLQLPEN